MWHQSYQDLPPDTPFVKEQVQAGKGIIGCEMHELNGWGERYHRVTDKSKKPTTLKTLWAYFSGAKVDDGES